MDPAALNRLEAFQRELEKEGSGLIYPFQVAYDPKIGAGASALLTLASDLRALLEERKAREGYVLVPRTPTQKMLRVMADQMLSHDKVWNARQAYHSALAAAPINERQLVMDQDTEEVIQRLQSRVDDTTHPLPPQINEP